MLFVFFNLFQQKCSIYVNTFALHKGEQEELLKLHLFIFFSLEQKQFL